MKKYIPGLWVLGLLALTGCGDTPDTILRTGINRKSELTDRLAKVKDEESAHKFLDHYLKIYMDKLKDLDDNWQKLIKDIDGDNRSKKINVLNFKSTGDPGSEQWQKDARDVPPNTDERIIQTRESFIAFMIKVNADTKRFNMEKERIKGIVQHLIDENPGSDPKKAWSNLSKLTEPETFRNLNLTGAIKLR